MKGYGTQCESRPANDRGLKRQGRIDAPLQVLTAAKAMDIYGPPLLRWAHCIGDLGLAHNRRGPGAGAIVAHGASICLHASKIAALTHALMV